MVAEGVFSTGYLSTYCSIEDVLALLGAFDLTSIGDETAQRDRIEELLPTTRAAVDQAAQRDFFWHAEDEIVVDGTGTKRLLLGTLGIWPLRTVHSIAVSGLAVAESDYVVYEDTGEVRLVEGARLGASFPAGVQNISVTADWGYEQVPLGVTEAQARLTAARVLAEAGGESLNAAQVRLGDYSVRYASDGRYAGVIERFVEEAQTALEVYRPMWLGAV